MVNHGQIFMLQTVAKCCLNFMLQTLINPNKCKMLASY